MLIANALIAFYRSALRHRLYVALNVAGLGLGIAVCLVLSLVVRFEYGFDRQVPHAALIQRMDEIWSLPSRAPMRSMFTTFAAYDPLRADFPQIAAATRDAQRDTAVDTSHGHPAMTVVHYVDPTFFDVFALPMRDGDAHDALAAPDRVAISESTARRLFGTVDARGRQLGMTENDRRTLYTVSAVFRDVPRDQTMRPDILAVFPQDMKDRMLAFHNWDSSSGQTWLRFRTAADAASVLAGLPDFVHRRMTDPEIKPGWFQLSLTPLLTTHFGNLQLFGGEDGSDRRVIDALGIVGILALAAAAINYVNLATARAGLRAREVALRKVLGATRPQLLVQFLAESVILLIPCALLGTALAEIALPFVNTMGGWAVAIDYGWLLPRLALVVLVVGIAAGLYPALVLSGYRPAAVLAASRIPSGGRMGQHLRTILVVAQFGFAITFAICTLVVNAQAAFIRQADRGFRQDQLFLVSLERSQQVAARQQTVMEALRALPGVRSVTLSDRQPRSNNQSNEDFRRADNPQIDALLTMEWVARDYRQTYGITLLAGRWFDAAHGQDISPTARVDARHPGTANVVINERALGPLGFSSAAAAIGHVVTQDAARFTIVGVVRDVRFMSPRSPVEPQVYMRTDAVIENSVVAVRTADIAPDVMLQRLQATWRTLAPEIPFTGESAGSRLAPYYQPDQQRGRLFTLGAGVAVVIACLGLYGLSSFNAARRVHEIGIRKTLGASTRDVLVLLATQFLRPVLLANLIAWPVAWMTMRGWLAGFDQRVGLSPLYFVVVSLAATALSLLTIIGQTLRVARAEPAKALRHE
ncbi:ABC transporter permease [Gluconacetobacter diazotrophicus]|uniref:FtsX-like permease family protein n=2 Tax=Gluconacetobacter diazotrophicus TaxID=33996 RepID=A0A7W4NFZ4_GLUDI|nr:ABC transporter permease [Gluconacetobacter diazotrophicus]MBB2157061.1 FtsX-like permease family protein [Gluconacetobacter diazotrophicus]TWB05564.1 putative ABC transport system permease protein [Gluconacetobacter diazotrophicus]CAP57663.1 putative transmembrane transport protein [Gluconacetobacter diazotrophicus PA1 5]